MIVAIAFVITIVIGMPIALALAATGLIHGIDMGTTNLFTTLILCDRDCRGAAGSASRLGQRLCRAAGPGDEAGAG